MAADTLGMFIFRIQKTTFNYSGNRNTRSALLEMLSFPERKTLQVFPYFPHIICCPLTPAALVQNRPAVAHVIYEFACAQEGSIMSLCVWM